MNKEEFDAMLKLLTEIVLQINDIKERVDALEKQCSKLWNASGRTNASIHTLDGKITEVKRLADNLECKKEQLRAMDKDVFREALKHIKIERIY